ncbi:MAG TPA: suppressor of fused domain protein [Polyangium sp.]|nr:suppressor of fused domain protein [Polyangium sp.]
MNKSDSPERAADGTPILRHQAVSQDFQSPVETACVDEIEAHMTKYFGKPTNVFHELVSDKVHIDVHFIPPSKERNQWTLFTTGMSALIMNVPPGADDFEYAELMISLPPNWNVDALAKSPPPADLERWYWPIRWLKQLARLPHDYNTWLGPLHTIPNGDPPRPFSPETRLCGWVLLLPFSVPEEGQSIVLSDGRVVRLYALYALYAEEMELKLQHGGQALLDALAATHATEVLSLTRKSAKAKKKR